MSNIWEHLEVAYPAMLWALLLVPLLFYVAWRNANQCAVWRPVAQTIVHVALVAIVVFAAAGLAYRGTSRQRYVIFIDDVSASVQASARQRAASFVRDALAHRGSHQAAFLSFAGKPGQIRRDWPAAVEELDVQGSNPADAVLLAAAAAPADHIRQIVLLADGNQTAGDLLAAARAAGVAVSVVPLASFSANEVCVSDVLVPAHIGHFEPFAVQVVVTSNHNDEATVKLYRDGTLQDARQTELKVGDNIFSFPLDGAERRLGIEVVVESAGDTIADNNRREAVAIIDPPPRVLLVDSEPNLAGPFANALRLGRFDVTLKTPQELSDLEGSFAQYDAILLSDVSPQEISAATLAAMRDYVHELAGALIVLGGEKTFGSEVFRASALESMLPVKASAQVTATQASLAMVLVMDKSSSMLEEQRLELAKQGAQRVVGLLSESDKIGILAFGSDSQWISETLPLSDKQQLLRRIDTLAAEGQTNMYPALERAFLALAEIDADRRHVIVLTDGVSSPGDFGQIARQMADAGIRVSTVSIGKGADQTILKQISELAGGQHRHCDEPADLANIVVEVAETAAAEDRGREFRPYVLRRLPGWDIDSAPPLLGYVASSPKPGAEILLLAAEGDPLLAWWPYGIGTVTALTSDAKDRWAQHWHQWPAYADFWRQLIDNVTRNGEPQEATVNVSRTNGQITVTLDALDGNGNFLDGAPCTLNVAGPSGRETTVPMPQVAPGRYEATFAASGAGAYPLTIECERPSGVRFEKTRVLVIDYPDELRVRSTNEQLLRDVARISGGAYDPQPEAIFELSQPDALRVTPLWPFLVRAGLVLLVIDVALRRLAWQFRQTRP